MRARPAARALAAVVTEELFGPSIHQLDRAVRPRKDDRVRRGLDGHADSPDPTALRLSTGKRRMPRGRRPEELSTARLLLEPLRVAHAAEMAAVLDDEELHRHVGGRPQSVDELRERYERQARGRSPDGSQRWFNWIIRERASGDPVGYVQATIDLASGVADVAWVVGTRHQGHGFAREAAAAMLSWL